MPGDGYPVPMFLHRVIKGEFSTSIDPGECILRLSRAVADPFSPFADIEANSGENWFRGHVKFENKRLAFRPVLRVKIKPDGKSAIVGYKIEPRTFLLWYFIFLQVSWIWLIFLSDVLPKDVPMPEALLLYTPTFLLLSILGAMVWVTRATRDEPAHLLNLLETALVHKTRHAAEP